MAVQTACPQVLPQFCFRLAHFFAHGFGALMQGGVVGGQVFRAGSFFIIRCGKHLDDNLFSDDLLRFNFTQGRLKSFL